MKDDEILKAEIIGKHTEVVDAENKSLIGIKGKIIDETKNTITLDNGKKLLKAQITIKMTHKNKTYEINGKLLVNRPEERIKKVRTLQ